MVELITALSALSWPGAITLTVMVVAVVAIVLGFFWLLSGE